MERPSQNDSGGHSGGIKIEIKRAPINRRPKGRVSIFGNDYNDDESKVDPGTSIKSVFGGDVECVEPQKIEGPPVIEHIEVNRWAIVNNDSSGPETSEPPGSTENDKSPRLEVLDPIRVETTQTDRPNPKYGLIIPPKRNRQRTENQSLPEVPILKKNSIPGIDKIKDSSEKYLHDIKHRPDNVCTEDYERISVSDFGMAMLRGMGWKEGKPIGRSSQSPVKIYEPTSRPSLLGLGAKPLPIKLSKSLGKEDRYKDGNLNRKS